MCNLAFVNKLSVVCRFDSGPSGTSPFNFSRHKRRWARLQKQDHSSIWEFHGGPEGTPKKQVLKEYQVAQAHRGQIPMTTCQINIFWNQTTPMKTKEKQNPRFSIVKSIYHISVRVGTRISAIIRHAYQVTFRFLGNDVTHREHPNSENNDMPWWESF